MLRRPRTAGLLLSLTLTAACAATGNTPSGGGSGSGAGSNGGSGAGGGIAGECDVCFDLTYTPCDEAGEPGAPVTCPEQCANGVGCVSCIPGGNVCVGNEVHACLDDGSGPGALVEICDTNAGLTCHEGACKTGCELALGTPSNVGCEFWAVDLDQVDSFNDPASAPWGVVLSNVGDATANVTIDINTAPVGQPVATGTLQQVSVPPGTLVPLVLPTREVDCGLQPNDYNAPGTCLSSNAYRITSSAPIVVYQFNVFENAFSNDASLLLPTNALGKQYRVIGWPAGHPVKLIGNIIDRSYVTIVGVEPNTTVTVKPRWRIRGNPPVPTTDVGGEITLVIGPFDVLNLETDDATLSDDPATATDLSGTLVQASAPVAVFSGVETTSAPGGVLTIPTYPGWESGDTCCLDHLEEQMFPIESVGKNYVVMRSPIRSTGSYHEPDVLRFLGVAETATVTTTLPPPYDSFTIAPGEVVTTYAQADVVVQATAPVMIGQILVSNEYVDGPYVGDPSLTVFPPVEQYRTQYVILTPGSWSDNYVVIAAPVGSSVTIDEASPSGCVVAPAGTLDGVAYEARRCPVSEGQHRLSGDQPFGIVAYGYGSAGSYAFAGGADVEKVYEPPPIPN
jgi:hypothetical protein